MACNPPNTLFNGTCYLPCPDGWEETEDNMCRQNCPYGYNQTDSACIRPLIERQQEPLIECPPGAQRVYNQCLLACPEGTTANFEICVPDCPAGFTTSADQLNCISELIPRTAVIREACYQGEKRSGAYCLAPCPEGSVEYAADPTVCYRTMPINVQQYFITYGATSAKVKFQRKLVNTTCPVGYKNEAGICYKDCGSGSKSDGQYCMLECPSGFTSIQSGGCARPIISRVIATSGVSVLEKYFKYALVAIVFFIAFNFVRKLLKR